MSYGLEVYNGDGDLIISPTSTLGQLVTFGSVARNQQKYDDAAAAHPNWVTNPWGNLFTGVGAAPTWFIWGELVDITVNVPSYYINTNMKIVVSQTASIFAGNSSIVSSTNGSFNFRRNDKFNAYYWIVRTG